MNKILQELLFNFQYSSGLLPPKGFLNRTQVLTVDKLLTYPIAILNNINFLINNVVIIITEYNLIYDINN